MVHTTMPLISSGNDGSRACDTVPFPAKHPEVISVGGHDEYGKHAALSSEGDHIDFLCQSENVQSTGRYFFGDLPTGSNSPYDKGPILTYCPPQGGVTVLYTNGKPGAWGV